MATLSVDGWALHELTLDFADQYVGDLIANAADAKGRGINLHVTQDGQPLSLSGMAVYLIWRHDQIGTQGQTQFTAVDASSGNFTVYYPAGMMFEGTVTARISIYVGNTTPITGSRDFRILVERNPIDASEAMASDDFDAFVQATIDLNELNAQIVAAESVRASEFASLKSESQQATATAEAAAKEAKETAASAAQSLQDQYDAFTANFTVDYDDLTDDCKETIAQSASTGASVITDEEGLEMIDNMATLIISGREAGVLSEEDGIALIDAIFS